MFRLESPLLDPRLESELPRPLLLRPLLLPLRDVPSSRLPPRSRLLSDELREEPLPPRDELPDPDDLFDWFAMKCSSKFLGCALRRIRFVIAARKSVPATFANRLRNIAGNPCA